jgi:hypothetical protein
MLLSVWSVTVVRSKGVLELDDTQRLVGDAQFYDGRTAT